MPEDRHKVGIRSIGLRAQATTAIAAAFASVGGRESGAARRRVVTLIWAARGAGRDDVAYVQA